MKKFTIIYALLVTLCLGLMCGLGAWLQLYSPGFAWGLFGLTWLVGAVVIRAMYKDYNNF